MKYFIALFSLLFLLQCDSTESPTTAAVIESRSLEQIQLKKAEVVKQLNTLEDELQLLNSAINQVDKKQKFLLVSAIELQTEDYQHYVSFQANLTTDQNVVIYPELPAILNQFHVKEGEQVSQGQLLASLSDSGLQDQLEQMQLQLALAKTTFERQKRLWDQKIGSEIQYLQAQTQYKSLQKSVAQMEDQVAKTQLTAPFDGVIDHLIADAGSTLAPGMTPVLRIVNLDRMRVSAEVPEIHLPNIQKKSPTKVFIPLLNQTYAATVQSVGNFINPNNRSFRLEIELENPKGELKPNMTAEINVNDYRNPTAILVDSKNILEDQKGATYVYKLVPYENQENVFTATKTYVEIGRSTNTRTEILSGLNPKDQIIEEGLRLVQDQQLVKIIQS